jgi:hypothetical protein
LTEKFLAKIGMENKNMAAYKKQTRAPLSADRDQHFSGANGQLEATAKVTWRTRRGRSALRTKEGNR